MLVLTQNQAKSKAATLHKFLAERGVNIPSSDMLNAVARMAGFEDWNAMATQFKERQVDAQLLPSELAHAKDSQECELRNEESGGPFFGPECQIQVASGFWLLLPGYPAEVDYVRVCDPLGREVAYWSIDEVTEDASTVIAAIAGALNRNRTDHKPDPLNPSADKIAIPDAPGAIRPKKERTGLSEIDFNGEWIRLSLRAANEPAEEARFFTVHLVYEEVLEALDAERLGTATEEDIGFLEDQADVVAIDWGDENEGEGLDTKDLRGIKAGPGASWVLHDGRIMQFHRLQAIA